MVYAHHISLLDDWHAEFALKKPGFSDWLMIKLEMIKLTVFVKNKRQAKMPQDGICDQSLFLLYSGLCCFCPG